MFLSKFNKNRLCKSLFALIPALIWATNLTWVGLAQDLAAPQTESWRDGLKLIDSPAPADLVAAHKILSKASRVAGHSAGVDCALAILCLRQDDPRAALDLIEAMPKRFDPQSLLPIRLHMLRMRLYAALELGNGPTADTAFKDLVRSVVAATNDQGAADPVDLRHTAITIAVVVAMLEVDLANSPISKQDLAIGQTCMLTSKISGVASAYNAAFAQASDRSLEMVKQFDAIKQHGIASIEADHAERLKKVDKLFSELEQQKDLAAEIYRNAKEQTGQNTRDQRKLQSQISSLQNQLRQPTPGHPGPLRPAPAQPLRGQIFVEEYETITDYESRYSNGETIRVPVRRTVRRDQWDIDRDRNRIYERMMAEYRFRREEYDRYALNYQKALASWNADDRARRDKLSSQIADAESKRKELIDENNQIKAEQKVTAKGVLASRTASQQEEFELQLQAIALAASKAGDVSSAFRPRHFPVLSWLQERLLISQHFK